jgi:hypothetical protein
MRTRLLLAPAIALLAASAPLTAQPPEAEAPADPLYHVEIIVFAWLNADRTEEDFRHGRDALLPAPAPRRYPLPGLEIESLRDVGIALPGIEAGAGAAVGTGAVPTGPEPSDAQNALPAGAPGDGLELIAPSRGIGLPGVTGQPAGPRLPDGFRLLAPEELTLTANAASLRQWVDTRVLGHIGWEQAGVDTDRSLPVDLRHLGISNPVGTIEVWISRFRHAIVDLEYFDGSGSLWSIPAGQDLAPLAYAQSYRLQADERNIRELRYVDHPLFGVVILITPAPAPANPAGSGPDGGPAA